MRDPHKALPKARYAALLLSRVLTVATAAFECDSKWQAQNADVRCTSIGGVPRTIEVKDLGGWSHAYQTVSIKSADRGLYRVSGSFFAEATGECDSSAAVRAADRMHNAFLSLGGVQVRWCSPSVVVCSGPHSRLD